MTSSSLCRYWQDLGYMIVYVTGRPDMQKQRVVAWLSQHNFPHGVVSFCDGLVHDPLRHKANFLKTLIGEVSVSLRQQTHQKVPPNLTRFPLISLCLGPHEDLCRLRLQQGHLRLLVYRPASVSHLHSGEAHQENAASVSGMECRARGLWRTSRHHVPAA